MKTIKLNLKIIIITSIFSIITLSFNSDEDKTKKLFYYAFDEKVQIIQLPDKLLVKKKPTLQKSNFEKFTKQLFGQVEIYWLNTDICKVKIKDVKNRREN